MKAALIFIIVSCIICRNSVNAFAQNQTITESKDTLKAEDILEMSLVDLMNTKVTSASKVNQEIRNVSAMVQVITANQIKERGYFTLEEALGDLPGFQFRNIVGFNSYVFMRGAPSQNNLILLLVDGVQINELNSGGFYAGGQFQMSNIDRIEVVYGPVSSLYGTNAVSGVINIITKSADIIRSGHISLLGGNFRTGMIDFNVRGKNNQGEIGYSISGMYKSSEKANLAGAAGDNNWTEQMENFENDISLSSRFNYKKFSAGIDFQEKMSSMTTNYRSVGDKYLDKNTLWDIIFLNGFAKYVNNNNEKLGFSSTLYYRNATVKPNTVNNIEKPLGSYPGTQVGYYRPNSLIGIENQLNWKAFDRMLVTFGLVTEFEKLASGFSVTYSESQDTPPPKPSRPVMLDNALLSYYLQSDLKISSKLAFVGGVRHDFSSYYGNVFTPHVGIILNAGKFVSKLLYNRAFRAPRPWDYNFGEGNLSLKPEKMRSIELFATYSFNKNLSAGLSLYNNLINDKLILQDTPAGGRWINEAEVNTTGFELYLNYSSKSINTYFNYTYTDSYDEIDLIIPEISKHNANAGLTYTFGKHTKASLRANYIGNRNNPQVIISTGDVLIKEALLFHATLSYLDLGGFDLQLKINNLFNTEYYHPSNRFAGRYRQPGRMVTLMVTYNLFR